MTIGMQFFNASMVKTFDTSIITQGAMADFVIVPFGGGNLTKTYPDFAGRTAAFIALTGNMMGSTGLNLPTVDYALGYPRVVYPRGYSGFDASYATFFK